MTVDEFLVAGLPAAAGFLQGSEERGQGVVLNGRSQQIQQHCLPAAKAARQVKLAAQLANVVPAQINAAERRQQQKVGNLLEASFLVGQDVLRGR